MFSYRVLQSEKFESITSMQTLDAIKRTCQAWWPIEMGCEKE